MLIVGPLRRTRLKIRVALSLLSSLLVISSAFAGASRARAQEDQSDPVDETEEGGASADGTESLEEEEARGLFAAGTSAFENGRYESALDYFQRAYDLSGRPRLLYNVGLCADLLHQTGLAIASFDAYLENMPGAENREEVQSRLRALRELEADVEVEVEESGSESQDDSGAEGPGAWPWALTVGGGVLMLTGGILLGYALGERSALEDIPEGSIWAEESGRYDTVTALSATGIVALVIGGATLTTGIVWLLTGSRQSESDVEPIVGLGYVGLRGRL